MQITNALFALGAALAGCGSMTPSSVSIRDAIGDALDEDRAYLATTREITAMPPMIDEVDHHTGRMTSIMDDMGSHMAAMHCPGIESMMHLRDGMHVEIDAHAATMHGMTRVDDAHVEVERHVGTMSTMLGDMDSMMDGMHCAW